MNSTRKRLLSSFLLLVILVFSPRSRSQVPSPVKNKAESLDRCKEARQPAPFAGNEEGMFRAFSNQARQEGASDCPITVAENRLQGFASSEEPREFSRSTTPAAASPLNRLGPAGPEDVGGLEPAVVPARELVLKILTGENECSQWLRQSDPQIARTFQSLTYEIELHGSDHVLRERGTDGNWFDHGPYIARTTQDAGPGTIVTINANGAFFRARGELYRLDWEGGIPSQTGTRRNVHVGPYDGGTSRAQMTTLLHELAHVVGAIPEDDSAKFGFNRSQQNTELILRHCKRGIDLSARSAKSSPGAELPN